MRMNALLETIVNAAGPVKLEPAGLPAELEVPVVPGPIRERVAPEGAAVKHRVLLVEDNLVNQKLAFKSGFQP